MKYEIMTGMLFDLLSKKSVKATYLANKYEVTTRTVYRYIDELSLAGVPIESSRGASGGFKIMDGFKLSASYLTEKEFEVVINSLSAINNEVQGGVLSSAIDKLKATKRGVGAVNVKTGNLVIDAGAWCDSAGYKDKLSLINSAIDDGKVISFTYHDRNGSKSVRFAEPHTILFKEGTWYVYAFCRLREEFRFFKVGRMTDIKCIEESFTRRELPSNLPFETWYEHSSLIDVKLKVGGQSLFAVEEWLGVENIHEENGVFYATASLPDEDSLVGKILSFGVGVKVIAPDTLKNKIKKAVKDIYNGD